jgi:hypothetical protein
MYVSFVARSIRLKRLGCFTVRLDSMHIGAKAHVRTLAKPTALASESKSAVVCVSTADKGFAAVKSAPMDVLSENFTSVSADCLDA